MDKRKPMVERMNNDKFIRGFIVGAREVVKIKSHLDEIADMTRPYR